MDSITDVAYVLDRVVRTYTPERRILFHEPARYNPLTNLNADVALIKRPSALEYNWSFP